MDASLMGRMKELEDENRVIPPVNIGLQYDVDYYIEF
jgi:hypothetical protein